jgi:hypothetical protein
MRVFARPSVAAAHWRLPTSGPLEIAALPQVLDFVWLPGPDEDGQYCFAVPL